MSCTCGKSCRKGICKVTAHLPPALVNFAFLEARVKFITVSVHVVTSRFGKMLLPGTVVDNLSRDIRQRLSVYFGTVASGLGKLPHNPEILFFIARMLIFEN